MEFLLYHFKRNMQTQLVKEKKGTPESESELETNEWWCEAPMNQARGNTLHLPFPTFGHSAVSQTLFCYMQLHWDEFTVFLCHLASYMFISMSVSQNKVLCYKTLSGRQTLDKAHNNTGILRVESKLTQHWRHQDIYSQLQSTEFKCFKALEPLFFSLNFEHCNLTVQKN